MVLDKKIDFQGCEVTLRSVLQRHGNVEHVLGPELVTDLITGDNPVNIGGRLQQNKKHYESRVFKRKIRLPVDILRNRDTYPDIFAVSGMEKSGLVEIVPSDEEVGIFYFDEDSVTDIATQNNDVFRKRFIVLKGRNLKSSFFKLREIHKRETLHWLKYKDKTLLWKETCGDIYNLLKCIDAEITPADKRIKAKYLKTGSCEVNEESIWDRSQRTVLVVAEPGMEKSSTTTQVAWNTKKPILILGLCVSTGMIILGNYRKSMWKNSISIPLLNSSAVLHSLNRNTQTLTGICSKRRYRTVEI